MKAYKRKKPVTPCIGATGSLARKTQTDAFATTVFTQINLIKYFVEHEISIY